LFSSTASHLGPRLLALQSSIAKFNVSKSHHNLARLPTPDPRSAPLHWDPAPSDRLRSCLWATNVIELRKEKSQHRKVALSLSNLVVTSLKPRPRTASMLRKHSTTSSDSYAVRNNKFTVTQMEERVTFRTVLLTPTVSGLRSSIDHPRATARERTASVSSSEPLCHDYKHTIDGVVFLGTSQAEISKMLPTRRRYSLLTA